MIKALKNILYGVITLTLIATIRTSIEAKSPLEIIRNDDIELGNALLSSKWINRFSYYAPKSDPVKKLACYLWSLKKNIATLENEPRQMLLGPISTITPKIFGKLMGLMYTELIFEENNEELLQPLCKNYLNKITYLENKLDKYLSKIRKIKGPLREYDKQIRKLSVHIDKTKKDLSKAKKAYNKASDLQKQEIAKQIQKIKQKLEAEKKKVEKPRQKLFSQRKEKIKEKMKVSSKLSGIVKQIKAERSYLEIDEQLDPKVNYNWPRNKTQKIRKYLEQIKNNSKPCIKKIVKSLITTLKETNNQYAPGTAESILWAFFLSKFNKHNLKTCVDEIEKITKQADSKSYCLKHKRKSSYVNLINNMTLLKKRNVHDHQFAKFLYYSVDLKNEYVSSRVIRHALKNNLLTDKNIKKLVLKLIGKLQIYEYDDCDIAISPKVISAIVKSKAYNNYDTIMEYICQRPGLTLCVINKSPLEQDEFIKLFKIMTENRSISRSFVEKQSRKALLNACANGHKKTVKMLEKYHVSINIVDENKEGPLHKAAANGHSQLVEMLIDDYFVDINQENIKNETALHKASARGHDKVVSVLLTHKHIEINALDKKAETALHKSASGGHVKTFKTLLAHPSIKIDALDNKRETILHKAALSNNIEMLRLVLSLKKININHVDLHGETALHFAAKNKNRDFFYVLNNTKGMDTKKKNKSGQTAHQIAMKHGNTNAFKNVLTANTKKIKPKKKVNQYANVLKMKRNLQTMYCQIM